MDKQDKVFVAGYRGMVGSAIVRSLQARGFENLLLYSHAELDLVNSLQVEDFFQQHKPEVVILAAARVGGIQANIDHPAEFLYENLAIQNNVIHQSYVHGVKQFCFLSSSCAYPRECAQPMKEDALLTGPLEPTNEGYALAKLTGAKMVSFYRKQYGFNGITVMPCNLYGTNDSFDPLHSHVLTALVRKFVEAAESDTQEVTLWGTGIARRELMHVDDAAEAILYVMEHYTSDKIINIGWGEDITIKDLAMLIARKAGYTGDLLWDESKPNGMLRKCLDVSGMKALGFQPRITLEQGIEQTIREFKEIRQHHS